MPSYDTSRSDQIAADFLARGKPFQRKVQVFGREYSAPPDLLFKQLCPAREADWINGWTVDLIYTGTGYGEPLAVFRTPSSNTLGSGLWILSTVEPNRLLEAIMVHDGHDLLDHTRIDVVDQGNGKTHVTWTITLTALSEKGNTMIDMVPDESPAFVDELEYFLTQGALKPQVG